MKVSARFYIIIALFVAGAMLLVRFLVKNDMLDGTVGMRWFMVSFGILVTVTGNLVPKLIKRPRSSIDAERRTQAALRSVGWVITVAGLLYIAVWLAAPMGIAKIVSLAALAVAFLFTIYRGRSCRAAGPERFIPAP